MTVEPVARQRACLVLASTGEFDSRSYRVAATLAGRGHEVTVVARWRPGVPREERHPSGFRIVRVPASTIDGLPLPAFARTALERAWARRQRRGTGGSVGGGAVARSGLIARMRGGIAGAVRIAAIILTVRSHARRAREVAPPADVVLGMAFMGIPVALGVAGRSGARVVYDAADVYVDAGNIARLPRPVRALLGRLERRWARRADRVTTANPGYAAVIGERFGIEPPLVLLNTPPLTRPPAVPERRFHAALGLPADARVVLYHGGFSPDRGIEQLIEAIRLVDGAVLVLMGYGSLETTLRTRIAAEGLADHVRILSAVPQDELIAWIASADVAAMPIQPTTLNHRLTVPNKLFEAMAAGVPIVASDLPGMAPIVRETGSGLLVDPTDPAAIAGAIRRILEADAAERAAWRERALAAAANRYCWEREAPRLLEELGRLTGRPW